MTSCVILFLMSTNSNVAQEWRDASSKYQAQVETVISDDLTEVLNHPNFHKITVIVYSSYMVAIGTFQQVCERLPSLRWIHMWSAGIDRVVTFFKSLPPNVIITNARGAYSESLAEYVMAVILYFNKNIPRLLANKATANYDRFEMPWLQGKTLGIVGYGDIGNVIARIAKTAFNMRVIAVKRQGPSDPPPPLVDKLIVPNSSDPQSKLQIFRESDYVVNVLPATTATSNYCSVDEFNAMKISAVFINIGRGATVDEPALIQALKTRKIRGAALDVFGTEPLPADSELWKLDNLLISPHNADITDDVEKRGMDIFLQNLDRFMDGRSMLTPVDVLNEY